MVDETSKEIKNLKKKDLTSENNDVKDMTTRRELRERNRVPLWNDKRLVQPLNMEEGFKYKLVTDRDNEVFEHFNGGYEFVDRYGDELLSIDARMQDPSWKQKALSQPVGNGEIGYCMRIPLELWLERERMKVQKANEQAGSIKNPYVSGIPTQLTFKDQDRKEKVQFREPL
jgi:hypothetical protein